MIAVIQPDVKNWSNRETMKHGLEDLGYELLLCNGTDYIKYDEYDGFYGNVGWIREIINKNNLNVPHMGTIPPELLEFAKRPYFKVSMKEAVERAAHGPIFIKPVPENQKSFTGFVLDITQPKTLINIAHYSEDVIVSSVVNFVSEYRCFVYEKEIMDAKRYRGNFRISPNYKLADDAINAYVNQPVAYSIDIGVTDTGETMLVECNDMMSLGLYGLTPHIAARMLVDRWTEIYYKNKGKKTTSL